ncbi:MAG: hypothetical protein VW080_03435 [Flavobacteriaceae bacterium]
MNNLFNEKQRFTQPWIYFILVGMAFLPLYGMYQQFIVGKPFGNNPMSNWGLILFSVGMFLFVALLLSIKLQTVITNQEIRVRFFPFVKKNISWTNIKKAKVVHYDFVGYGIRLGSSYGTVYNIKGAIGLALQLRNGKKLLIGTQKEEELTQLLSQRIQPNSNPPMES